MKNIIVAAIALLLQITGASLAWSIEWTTVKEDSGYYSDLKVSDDGNICYTSRGPQGNREVHFIINKPDGSYTEVRALSIFKTPLGAGSESWNCIFSKGGKYAYFQAGVYNIFGNDIYRVNLADFSITNITTDPRSGNVEKAFLKAVSQDEPGTYVAYTTPRNQASLVVLNVITGQKQVYPYALSGGSLFSSNGVHISADGRYLLINTENIGSILPNLNCTPNHPVFQFHAYVFDTLTGNKRCGTPNFSLFFPALNAFLINDYIIPFPGSHQLLRIQSFEGLEGTPELARLLPQLSKLRETSGDGSMVSYRAAGPNGYTVVGFGNTTTGQIIEVAQFMANTYFNATVVFSNDGKVIGFLKPDENNAHMYTIEVAKLE